MENLDENRVPKAWVGREVAVRTRGPAEVDARTFGKLEDVHEGGVVISRTGPTSEVTELGPVLFYPWSSIEVLRLRAAPSDQRETRERSRDRAGADRPSRPFPPITAQKLTKVVPIAQRRSAAGVTVTLRALEIYEGGYGLIGYLIFPDPGSEEDEAMWFRFLEVRVRDDQGRSYEASPVDVRALGGGARGHLWVVGLPEANTADAAELEVEIFRLFKGPPSERRGEALEGSWVFRFPL